MTSLARLTQDAFLDGRIVLRQPALGYRSGLDAVFLAAAVPAKAGETVLEAGCGIGAASLCLLARVADAKATGVEIVDGLAALAHTNAAENGMTERFRAVAADVTAPWKTLEASGLKREFYDHVFANPPFYGAGRSAAARDETTSRARTMPEGGLESWCRFLAAAVRPSGTATIIHTADALPALLTILDGRFGALSILPLYPRRDTQAIRIVLRGVKGSRAPLSILPGFILHEDDGTPTAEATAILRHGAPLLVDWA